MKVWDDGEEDGSTVVLDPTPTAEEEKQDFGSAEEREARRLANKKLDLENQQFERDMANRENFAERAYGLTQAWVGFLFVVVMAQFGLKDFKVGLSQSEFITVVTTTTASMFGFWLLVGQYLFHRGPSGRPDGRAKSKGRKKAKKGS